MIRTLATDVLADWVSEVTGREAVFDNLASMGPRPSREFASLIVGHEPSGRHDISIEAIDGAPAAPEPDLRESSTVNHVLLVSMDLIGGETRVDMERLRAALGLSEWVDRFFAAGLGFARVTDSRDLTGIVKEEYEPRHQADWEFIERVTVSTDIQSIESVTVTNAGTGSSFTVGA